MILQLITPTRLQFDYAWVEAHEKDLKDFLTYENKKIQQTISRIKNAPWFSKERDQPRIDDLKEQRFQSLLLQDVQENYYTHSGLTSQICSRFNLPLPKLSFEYPEPKLLPWSKEDTRIPHKYQLDAVKNLLEVKHGGVEIATGLGKSLILLHLVKQLGLKTVVMAPSTSIAEQLYNDFSTFIGLKYVGQFWGGKKESKKQIVVAVAASLTRCEPEDVHWENLSKAEVFVSDEAHLNPAETLAKVCFGLLANAPYRFFFSATQLRQDGLDLLLKGIVGPIVYRMSLREGVDQGYLAKPLVTMAKIDAPNARFIPKDPNKTTKQYLYQNKAVNAFAGYVANQHVNLGRQVLILIDEVEQFSLLLPYFEHKAAFAHGKLTDNKKFVPEAYQDSDPNELVAEFNAGKIPILVGTSCIATGTDIKNNGCTIYLVGGCSEIAVRQGALGRSLRLQPSIGKTECHIVDFSVENIPLLKRHAQTRAAIYSEEYGPVDWVNV